MLQNTRVIEKIIKLKKTNYYKRYPNSSKVIIGTFSAKPRKKNVIIES